MLHHVSFGTNDIARTRALYRAALAHGGRDAGPPRLRAAYDDHYYGAFVFDPEGNKLEAVTYSAK